MNSVTIQSQAHTHRHRYKLFTPFSGRRAHACTHTRAHTNTHRYKQFTNAVQRAHTTTRGTTPIWSRSHCRPAPSVCHIYICSKTLATTGTPQSHIPCCKPPFHYSNVFILTALLSADANKLMLLVTPNWRFCFLIFSVLPLYSASLSVSLVLLFTGLKRQTDRQTDRRTDRQTNRQTVRQTDSQTTLPRVVQRNYVWGCGVD